MESVFVCRKIVTLRHSNFEGDPIRFDPKRQLTLLKRNQLHFRLDVSPFSVWGTVASTASILNKEGQSELNCID